ncbi:MAG: hypothetical protein AAF769_09045 [Pseudomonadota bacterium]
MIRSVTLLLAVALTHSAAAHHTHSAEHEGDALSHVLESDIRADDRARDKYRNPGKTLRYFGIKPEMTVGEYGPGGGWYTRVIAPLVSENGTYVAIGADVERYHATADEERKARLKAFPETFPGRVTEWTGIDAKKIAAVEIDEASDWAGKLDAVVTFRGFHGLARKDMTDETIAHFYSMLKPGGIVGVVQHRADEDAPYDYTRGHNGYLKQSEVVAMFESEGFELVKDAEFNANPKDTADHEGGVWSLPPTLRHGDTDRDRYTAIGESDRMTLVFRKPA